MQTLYGYTDSPLSLADHYREREEEEEEEEEGLFKADAVNGEEEEGLFRADAVNEEDPERDHATQV